MPDVMGLMANSSVPHGQRSLNRLRLGLPASLILTHVRRHCVLDNISATGACVRVEQAIAKGLTAILCFHELRIYCTVAWSRDASCGLRFESRLDQEDMQGLLWITQNREEYERICREMGAEDWATGFGA